MRLIILAACFWFITSCLHAKIVFTSRRDSNFMEVYTMNSDGTNQTRLTFEMGRTRSPVWSPNGQQIAFEVHWGMDINLFVMDADGNNQRVLTPHPEIDRSPHWHPDGKRIAFSRNISRVRWGHDEGIYTIDINGGEPQLVTKAHEIKKMRWSPDGTRIAFSGTVKKDDPIEIHVTDADGKRLWRVSKPLPETYMILGDWSPDSRKLLYTVIQDAAEFEDYIEIATLHSELQQVIKRERLLKHIDPQIERWEGNIGTHGFGWSPDGQSILIGLYLNKNWDIYRYRLADGKRVQLTDDKSTDRDAQEWNLWLAVPRQQKMLPKTWGEMKRVKQ